jgi:hypothetical protein
MTGTAEASSEGATSVTSKEGTAAITRGTKTLGPVGIKRKIGTGLGLLNEGRGFVKIFLSAIAIASLVAIYSGVAQAYDPYYDVYDPYAVPAQYDPYYELHQIHYQLYLKPYSYPFFVTSPARVIVVAPPVVVGTPFVATPARAVQSVRRR